LPEVTAGVFKTTQPPTDKIHGVKVAMNCRQSNKNLPYEQRQVGFPLLLRERVKKTASAHRATKILLG